MKTTMRKLHFNSLLHVHKGEPKNPFLWSSASWLAWEAIDRAKKQGQTVVDAWCGRGCAVNIWTSDSDSDSVTAVSVL